MTPVKKFLSPTLYPANRDITRAWFIKYYEEDFNQGGFKPHKYVGMLNREPDLEKRLQLAQHYINLMHRNEPLPSYQGQKTLRVQPTGSKPNTNVIQCCNNFLKIKQAEGYKNSTAIHYKSKIKLFAEWLVLQGKQNCAIGAIDKETALNFLISLLNRGLSASTYNDYKSLLGSIWHEYRKQIQHNPWRDIKSRRNEVQHLKKYPDNLQAQIAETLPGYNMQLWLFMQCIYYCAIRPHSELRLLQVKHIDFDNAMFTVPAHISKNGKARTVNIYKGLLQQLIDAG